MHKLVILITPRFTTDPVSKKIVSEIQSKVFLYEKDKNNSTVWKFQSGHTRDYEKTVGKIYIGTKIIAETKNGEIAHLLPLKININLVEWLQQCQVDGGDQSGTELEILLSASISESGPSLDVHTITSADLVKATVSRMH